MNELLPCPHCGSAATLLRLSELPEDDPNWNGWYIECNNAQCRASTNIHFGEAERPLVEKWNRRQMIKDTAEEVSELAAKIAESMADKYDTAVGTEWRDGYCDACRECADAIRSNLQPAYVPT